MHIQINACHKWHIHRSICIWHAFAVTLYRQLLLQCACVKPFIIRRSCQFTSVNPSSKAWRPGTAAYRQGAVVIWMRACLNASLPPNTRHSQSTSSSIAEEVSSAAPSIFPTKLCFHIINCCSWIVGRGRFTNTYSLTKALALVFRSCTNVHVYAKLILPANATKYNIN